MQLSSTKDHRAFELGHWVAEQLGQPKIDLSSLGGDAGFRRYFRFASPSQYLAVDAPPETENTAQFIRIAQLLTTQEVRTPKILMSDDQKGFLLVEDLGDQLVYNNINLQNADAIYSQANYLILLMQKLKQRPDYVPLYDSHLLQTEMQLCIDWFLEKLLRYELSKKDRELFKTSVDALLANAVSQPQVLVHRDFHSRNLLVTENNLATIDFQGALWGPMTYDLASLLKDCYLRWPQEKVQQWALDFYHKKIPFSSITVTVDEFLQWFDLMGLQRHIKVLGIFARLAIRDNKKNYLRDLPLVLRYVIETCIQYKAFNELGRWFVDHIIPLAEYQDWYSNYTIAGESL